MEIIVRIETSAGEAGYYKLVNIYGKYKWTYLWIDVRKRNLYLTLFKGIKEYYDCEIGYNFDFEEGDLESLR